MKNTLTKKRRNKKNVLLKMSKEQIELFEIEYWKRYNIARQSRWSARESHKLEVGGSSPPRAQKQIDSFLFKWLNLIQEHTTIEEVVWKAVDNQSIKQPRWLDCRLER